MWIYWLWLSLRHMSDREKIAVLSHIGSAEDVYYALSYESLQTLSKEAKEALLNKDLEEAEKIQQLCCSRNIQILAWSEPEYPAKLRSLADPPLVLYVLGQMPDWEAQATIGVVGTRKASAYGLRTANRLGSELAACGGLVVSGMAAGVDTQAIEGALSQGRPAVGVLGCGVDVVYPASNRKLYEIMEQQGCLISEFPPQTPAYKWHFPKRNRIISGLSDGVLVVEAPKISGALITARQALEQGRDVFVVPGNVDVASCEGSNGLLKEGASMAASGWDILSEYVGRYSGGLEEKQVRKAEPKPEEKPRQIIPVENLRQAHTPVDPTEEQILHALEAGTAHVDVLAETVGIPTAQLLAALTMLEIQGLIVTQPGGWVEKL